jgi:hypothetical protein
MPWSIELFEAAVRFPDAPRVLQCSFTSSVSAFVSSVKISGETSLPTSCSYGNAFTAFLSEFHRCWHQVFIPCYNLSLSQLLPHELAAVSVPIHDWRLENVVAPSPNCKRLGDVWLQLPASVDSATSSALDSVGKILKWRQVLPLHCVCVHPLQHWVTPASRTLNSVLALPPQSR